MALKALANWSFYVEEEGIRCQEAAQEIECGIQWQGGFVAALREARTLAQLCAEFQVHSTQITEWS